MKRKNQGKANEKKAKEGAVGFVNREQNAVESRITCKCRMVEGSEDDNELHDGWIQCCQLPCKCCKWLHSERQK
jgi:hypothetical protein